MKRLILILVAVLAIVGIWVLIEKDETTKPQTYTTVLQHIDPVDTVEEPEPTPTAASSTTQRSSSNTARNTQQASSQNNAAAQNAADQNEANANANADAAASQNATTATDAAAATTTATESTTQQTTTTDTSTTTTTQTTESTQQTTQTTAQDSQTTQTTDNSNFGQPGNIDFDDTDEQTDQDIGTTTEAGTPEEGDWVPDFSGSDAEGAFFGGEPNHDADTGETPEP